MMATTFYEDSMERKRRMLPMSLGMASPDGVLTQNVQPGSALPMTAQRYREMALKYGQEAADAENEQPDLTAAQEYLRKRSEGGDMAMLNALAAQFAGERFQPVQAQFLKRASEARDPLKIGTGMLTPDGQYVRDTVADAQRRAAAKARQAQAYEQMATGLETAEQRRQDALERSRQTDEFKRLGLDMRQQGLDLQRAVAANRQQGGQVGSFSPAGFTPQGQQVVTNTKSGVSYLLNILPDGTPNYTPYQGAMIPKATFDKEVTAAGDLSAVAARADKLVQAVEANPNAFGLRSAAVSSVPGAMQGYAAKAVGLTPAQLEARSTVLRQAAQEINELYGAALSMGEQARANTFLPNPADPPEMLISKLKAARDWAKTQMSRYSPAVTNAATQRSGGGMQAGTGGLSDAEMQELAQLRAKHKKGQQ